MSEPSEIDYCPECDGQASMCGLEASQETKYILENQRLHLAAERHAEIVGATAETLTARFGWAIAAAAVELLMDPVDTLRQCDERHLPTFPEQQ